MELKVGMRVGGIERAMCEFRGLCGHRSRKGRIGGVNAQRGCGVLGAAIGTVDGAADGAGAGVDVDMTTNVVE